MLYLSNGPAGTGGGGRLRVLDVLGRVYYEHRFTAMPTELDLSHLPGGNYYLHLVTPHGETTVKQFVKE